jgi:hypothetical protein
MRHAWRHGRAEPVARSWLVGPGPAAEQAARKRLPLRGHIGKRGDEAITGRVATTR